MSENSIKSESHIDAIVRQKKRWSEGPAQNVSPMGWETSQEPVFVVLHLVFLIGWLLVNSGSFPAAATLTPAPLLGVIVAVEAVVLFQLHTNASEPHENRGERRDHLNLHC